MGIVQLHAKYLERNMMDHVASRAEEMEKDLLEQGAESSLESVRRSLEGFTKEI